MKKGLLVASGGIDSTVLMYQLAKKKKLAEVFFCNYGQASARRQINLLKYHCKVLGVPLWVQKIDYPQGLMRPEVSQSGFTPKKKATLERMSSLGKDDLYDFMKEEFIYLDGRNTLFLLYAALRAEVLGVGAVYTGFQYDKDQWVNDKAVSFWGDVSPKFVSSMNSLFELTMIHNVKVVCPFYESKSDKAEIVALGRKLGVDLNKTYSCDFYPACGKCVTCSQAEREGIVQSPRRREEVRAVEKSGPS